MATIIITIEVPNDHPWAGDADGRPEELAVVERGTSVAVEVDVDGDGTYSGEAA